MELITEFDDVKSCSFENQGDSKLQKLLTFSNQRSILIKLSATESNKVITHEICFTTSHQMFAQNDVKIVASKLAVNFYHT